MDDRPAEEIGTRPPTGRIPAVAEVFGYVGGALALAAVAALVGMFWVQLGVYGRVGIAAALAVAGLVGGFLLDRVDEPAARRLAQFLLFAGVAGVGAAVGFAVQHIAINALSPPMRISVAAAKAAEWAWFSGALAVAISGGLVWWRRSSWLQHLAFGVGVAATSLLVLPLLPVEGPDWGAGAVLVLVSMAWGALALSDLIPPRVEGLALATLGIVGGIEMMAVMPQPAPAWPLWLGAAACIALVVAGSRMKELAVLGVAAAGLAAFSGQLVAEYLGFGIVAALGLIVVGFGLVANSVRLARSPGAESAPSRDAIAEISGYLGTAFALGGAGILLIEYWEDLGVAGRIIVPLVASAFAYACALMHEKAGHGWAHRLSQVLFFVGVLSVGFTAAMIARPFTEDILGPPLANGYDLAGGWAGLAGTLVAVPTAVVTWWRYKGAPTQLAFIFSVIGVVVAAMATVPPDNIQTWMPATALLVIGVTWVSLGLAKMLLPSNTAIAAGSLAAVQALQMLQMNDQGGGVLWAAWLGIGLCVAAIVVSVVLKRGVLLGFGAYGLVMLTITTLQVMFAGRIAVPVLLLMMGVVFIAVAVAVVLILPRIRHTPPQSPLPAA